MGSLAILNAGIACTRVILTVGANVPTTSGKETGITNASWNVWKVKRIREIVSKLYIYMLTNYIK